MKCIVVIAAASKPRIAAPMMIPVIISFFSFLMIYYTDHILLKR